MTEREIQLRLHEWMKYRMVVNTTAYGWESDVIAVTRDFRTREYEIKTSVADFKNDFKDGRNSRWHQKSRRQNALKDGTSGKCPNLFYYVVPSQIADRVKPLVPQHAGLISIPEGRGRPKIIKHAPTLHKNQIDMEMLWRLFTSASFRAMRSVLHDVRTEKRDMEMSSAVRTPILDEGYL